MTCCPYLAIAKRFGVDYGDVLLMAEWYSGGCTPTDHHRAASASFISMPNNGTPVLNAVSEVVRRHR